MSWFFHMVYTLPAFNVIKDEEEGASGFSDDTELKALSHRAWRLVGDSGLSTAETWVAN